jgi:hypothetical protein
MTWLAIRTLEKLGLAWDIQGLPAAAERFRLDRQDREGATPDSLAASPALLS